MGHGLTLVFSVLWVLLSHLWEKEKGGGEKKWRREGGKKGMEKERKEEEGIKKDHRQDKKEF